MGSGAQLRGVTLRPVLSGRGQFLFDECVRAAVLDGLHLFSGPHYQWRSAETLALVWSAGGTRLGKQAFHGVFRCRHFCWTSANARTTPFPGKMDLARRARSLRNCLTERFLASAASLAHLRIAEQHCP